MPNAFQCTKMFHISKHLCQVPHNLEMSPLDISVGKEVVCNDFIQEPKSDLQRKTRYLSQFGMH